MALTQEAVRVAGTGEVYFAPTGTAAPTDATTTLPGAWKGLGYTTPDGVQFQLSRDTNQIDAWQGSKVRVVTNSENLTIQTTMIETKTDTLLVAFGGGSVISGIYTPPAEGVNAERALVVDFTDGTTKYRYYFPKVQAEGDLSFNLTRSDALGYEITLGVLTSSPRWKLFTNDTTYLTTGS
jgi:hypothetical protein